jgi:hypothetical protein
VPRRVLAIAALAIALAAASCGGSDTADDVATSVVDSATVAPPAGLPSGDPSVTVVNAIQACREKDGDRLRAFVSPAVPDADVQALFARGMDVRLESQTVPEVEGASATVEVQLEVRREQEIEQVSRTWTLQLDEDGVWRFAGLPDCF